jgi:hypothetical protein
LGDDAMRATPPRPIFLAGPPGAGKTSLGGKACERLGLRFLDLPARDAVDGIGEMQAAIRQASADVIAVPWHLQQDDAAMGECRRAGPVVALWAHPLEMQARSGRTSPLFAPVTRLKTHGGFGRHGVGCGAYRRLTRSCEHVLMLVELTFDEALAVVARAVEHLRLPEPEGAAEREGLDAWARRWVREHGADREAAEILAEAIARYTLHLKGRGASPRRMAAVYSDLDAAAQLVMMYAAPKGRKVLKEFDSVPCSFEYERKLSDSPRAVARYEATLKSFASFLRTSAAKS